MKKIDQILEKIGGLGRFQALVILCIYSTNFLISWSMVEMVFGGIVPDWECAVDSETLPANLALIGKAVSSNDPTINSLLLTNASKGIPGDRMIGATLNPMYSNVTTRSMYERNDTLNQCSVGGEECDAIRFEGSIQSVIKEWALVCDRKWIKQILTSVQMAGVLLGSIASGHLGDHFGRKRVMYPFLLFHFIFVAISCFSISWEMFAVCRFFTGIAIGGHLVVVFPYSIEFFAPKSRMVLLAMPMFDSGIILFALAAYILENWWYLHLTNAILHIPFLLGWFFLPESPRWLTTHGKIEEAEKTLAKIARINGKQLPVDTREVLECVASEEERYRAVGKPYTYLDLFKGWKITQISLSTSYFWFVLNIVFYGISFNVSSLSGNFYLNYILSTMSETPVTVTILWISSKLGRKPVAITLFALSTLAATACLLNEIFEFDKGLMVRVLALGVKVILASIWYLVMGWGAEMFPTVTRNLGYGLANTCSRFGGILSPFIINLDSMVVASYSIMTGAVALCTILAFFLPETKGKALAESVNTVGSTLEIDSEESGPANEALVEKSPNEKPERTIKV